MGYRLMHMTSSISQWPSMVLIMMQDLKGFTWPDAVGTTDPQIDMDIRLPKWQNVAKMEWINLNWK